MEKPKIQKLAKRLRGKVYLDGFAIGLIQIIRKFRGVDRAILDDYFAEQKIRKLHIGSGPNILDDWLNSDLSPASDRVLHLNATKTFPFPNDTFEYIFSEHMSI